MTNKSIKKAKRNTSKTTKKTQQRFSLFICDWKEDHDWRAISAFQRKQGLLFMDSWNSSISDDKVLLLSDQSFTNKLANEIWEAALNAGEGFFEARIFTYADYLKAKEANDDAHCENCTCPDCSSIS